MKLAVPSIGLYDQLQYPETSARSVCLLDCILSVYMSDRAKELDID
jgi:hypothetical protein